MAVTKAQMRMHRRACKLLGVNPEKIRLVGASEWKELVGRGVGTNLGWASRPLGIIYVRRTAGFGTYIQEVLHHLFPSRPHRWIFGAEFRLARLTGSAWAYGRWQSADGASEGYSKIIKLARASARRRGLA
jgi:hypothetical protein